MFLPKTEEIKAVIKDDEPLEPEEEKSNYRGVWEAFSDRDIVDLAKGFTGLV